MTNERAIEILNRRTTIPGDDATWEEINEAIDIAIKTLEERPTGEWIMTFQGDYECPHCRSPHTDTPSFCPWCGADMRKENEE